MATKSSPPGFLAKMAQLVRAAPAAGQDAGDSEQSQQPDFSHSDLQARIQGKRRDDQVRRREFDHLRKVRATAGLGSLGLAAQARFAVSSSFNPEEVTTADRAHTLKKIDAIEAYMGEHLQRKRQADLASSRPAARPPAGAVRREVPVLTQSVDGPLRTTMLGDVAHVPEAESSMSDMDLDFTGMTAPTPLPTDPPPSGNSSMNSSFSESRLESQEMGGSDHPVLQDAAIRFAEGDVAGAEAALLALMQDAALDAAVADRCAWALMDLYRATDQSAAFDVVAIEYAQRFGRSAPEWYSIPNLLKNSGHPHQVQAPQSGATWSSPPLLTAQSVGQMAAAQQGTTRRLQWGTLESMAPDALPALTKVLTQWGEQPVSLVFGGAEVFNAVLEAATVAEQRETDPAWWLLRLEALRVQGAHEPFETVALDYCITYDVSPPSWLEAVCTYSEAHPAGEDAIAPVELDRPAFVDTRAPEGAELLGELLGDALPALDRLLAGEHIAGEPLVIHCRRLLRVDFSAAGSMLNWLAQRRAEGVEVQFVQVPRLVGVFVQLMGIAEHASVAINTK
jgi:ABC-type transporter Mla MlaB component